MWERFYHDDPFLDELDDLVIIHHLGVHEIERDPGRQVPAFPAVAAN
jgi:hypothetical protein